MADEQTLGDAIDLLTVFMRARPKATAAEPKAIPTPVGDPDFNLLPNVYEAMILGYGDFSDAARASWDLRDQPVSAALWYDKAVNKPIKKPTPPPLFSFDNAADLVGTLAWAIPGGGPLVAGAVGVGRNLVDNAQARDALEAANKNAQSSPTDANLQMVRQLESYIKSQSVNEDITSVFSKVNLIRRALTDAGGDPINNLDAARTGQLNLTKARDKGQLLNPDALGAALTLLSSDAWGRLVAGPEDSFMAGTVEAGLARNPSYADITLNAVAHAGEWLVRGLWAYAWIDALPPEAFRPGWDRTMLVDGQRQPYHAAVALRATRGAVPQLDMQRTGYEALCELAGLLDVKSQGNLITRLEGVRGTWARIFGRLCDDIVFYGPVPAGKRSNGWYLAKDSTTPQVIEPTFKTTAIPWKWFCEDVCLGDMIYCSDRSFMRPQAARDGFLEPFRHSFRTELTVNYSMASDAGSVVKDIFSFGIWAAGNAGAVHSLTSDWNRFLYPLKDGGNHDGSDVDYPEVFWLPMAPSEDAPQGMVKGQFLQAASARHTVAYLGFVLAQYVSSYQFAVDVQSGRTLAQYAEGLVADFSKQYQQVLQVQGA